MNRLQILLLLAVLAAAPAASAQSWPAKPIRMVLTISGGGETNARVVMDRVSQALGVPIVVDAQAGAGGAVGATQVAHSPPDGYTILFIAPNHAIGASLYKNLQFVFTRDSQPLAGMMNLTNVMVVPPSLPVGTLGSAIDYEWAQSADGKPAVKITAKNSVLKENGRTELDEIELRIYMKDAKHYDRVRSPKAEFSTSDNKLFAPGEAEITLGVPAEGEPLKALTNSLKWLNKSELNF